MKEDEEEKLKEFFTDEEIYKGNFYKSISRSIVVAFISGNLSCLGAFCFMENKISLLVLGIISVLLFYWSFFIGLKNLFADIPLKGEE